jgi:hypothetical protein
MAAAFAVKSQVSHGCNRRCRVSGRGSPRKEQRAACRILGCEGRKGLELVMQKHVGNVELGLCDDYPVAGGLSRDRSKL